MARSRRARQARPAAGLRSAAAPGLAAVLDAVDRWLYRKRRRMRLGLRPGLDDAGLASLAEALAGPVPDDLATLLRWHDGQSADFQGTFADGWSLLRADEIGPLQADLNADPPPGWQLGWLPWARDVNSFLALDPTTPGCPVRGVYSDAAESTLVAPSLEAWFTRFLADAEAGRYVEDPGRGTFVRTRPGGADSTSEEGSDDAC